MSDMAYKVSILCLLITAAKAGDVPSFQVPVNANQPTNIQITVTAIPANAPANSLHGIRYTPAFEHQQQYHNPNVLAFAPPQFQFSPIQFNSIAPAPVQAQPAFHIRAIPIQLAPQPVHLPGKAAPVHTAPAPLQILAKQAAPVQTAPAPLQYLTQQPAPIQSPFQIVAKEVEYNPPTQVETKSVQVPPLQFQLRQLQVPVQVQYAPAAPVAVQPAAVVKNVKYVKKEEFDANPQYEYGYDVDDAQTGDSKSQSEQRQGDSVQGSYSVIDPDGYKRTVEYTADPIHGFSAVVRREPVHAKGLLLRKIDVSRNYSQ